MVSLFYLLKTKAMSQNSLFQSLNIKLKSVNNHRTQPITPFKMIVDAQAALLVFMTKREYLEYLDTRDIELCRF